MDHIFKLSLYIWVCFLCFSACSTGEFKNPSIPDTEQQVDQDAEENDSLLLPTFSVEMLNKCNLEFSKDRWEEYFADVNCSKAYGTAQRCFIDANIYWCLEIEKFNFTDEINDQLKVIKLLDRAVPYIKTILTADFFDSLLLKDKMKLAGLFYRLNFAIACANLKILTSNDYRLDEHLIREYVRNYQKAKNELKTKFSVDTQNIQLEFFKNLSNIYMMASNKCPHIHSAFEPSIRKKLSQPRKNPSLTMLEAKRRSRNNKYSELTKDIFTASTMNPIDIFLDEEMNFVKDLDKKIEPINWKELSNRFLRLEKLAYKMVAYKEPFRMNPGKNLAHFEIEDWANLYIGIRSCTPSTEIYGFTRTGISIYTE